MARVITDFSKMTDEIATKRAVLFDQDEKEYGRAVGYVTKKGIYVYYKKTDEQKFLTVFFDNEEIKDKFLCFKNDEEVFEMFDCPDFNPRKIYLGKDGFILKNRKNGDEVIYQLDIEKIKDRF